MMNRYYGNPYRFSGRSNRDTDHGDRAPYRRPMGRGSMPTYPCVGQNVSRGGCSFGQNQTRGGCGCGSEQNQTRGGCGCNAERNRPHAGCGCGSEQNQSHDHDRGHDRDSAYDGRKAIPAMQNGGCGCGGNGGVSPARKKLMEQIRAVDFALYEVILYLDVHPNSCDALETYHKLKAQKEDLHKEYEATCGPITAFGNQSGVSWDWIGSPFPWEFGAE